MMDLIMYWSTVTVLVVGLTGLPLFGVVLVLHMLLENASDGKFELIARIKEKLWPKSGPYRQQEYYTNCVGISVCAFFAVVALGIVTLGSTGYKVASLVDAVATVADMTYLAIGWFGIGAGGYLLSFFVLRKGFRFYYSMQDKLNKLN